MTEPGTAPIVIVGPGRLGDHNVGRTFDPASPAVPALVSRISQRREKPPEAADRIFQIQNLKFDMVQSARFIRHSTSIQEEPQSHQSRCPLAGPLPGYPKPSRRAHVSRGLPRKRDSRRSRPRNCPRASNATVASTLLCYTRVPTNEIFAHSHRLNRWCQLRSPAETRRWNTVTPGNPHRALSSTFVMRKFVICTPAITGCCLVTTAKPCLSKNGRAVMLTSAARPRTPWTRA